MWWNDYIGLPYVEGGRSRDGVDCWGLVHLVYAQEFNTTLPRYDDVGAQEQERITAIVREQEREWLRCAAPDVGDVVVFNMGGLPTHVGVMIADGYFLHAPQGKTVCAELLASSVWSRRIEGYFRPGHAGNAVSAHLHPLRSLRADEILPPGLSLREADLFLRAKCGLNAGLPVRSSIAIDGEIIPPSEWATYQLARGQHVDFKIVPAGGRTLNTLLQIGSVVAGLVFAPLVAPYLMGIGLTATAATSLAAAGIMFAGQALTNFLFPVRQKEPDALDAGKRANLLLGGQNQPDPFGAVPVVLGRHRLAPKLGANNWVEGEASESYLRQLFVWGVGPLQIQDLRLGATALTEFEDLEFVTLEGDIDSEADVDRAAFDVLYGQDVTQVVPNIEVKSPWLQVISSSIAGSVVTIETRQDHEASVGDMLFTTQSAGLVQRTVTSVTGPTTLTYAAPNVPAGGVFVSPWKEQTLTDLAERISFMLHFPQGLRMIRTTGQIEYQPASFRFEYRPLDPLTGLPSGAGTWLEFNENIPAFGPVPVGEAFFNLDSDAQLEPCWRCTSVRIDTLTGKIVLRQGVFSQTNGNPNAAVLIRLQAANFGSNEDDFTYIPAARDSEIELWRVFVFGATIFSWTDYRSSAPETLGGFGITISADNKKITIASGSRARKAIFTGSPPSDLDLGYSGTDHHLEKDAFTKTVTYRVPKGLYQVRVARVAGHGPPSVDWEQYTYMDAAYLVAVTGVSNSKPVTPPVPLAMTAMRIRATNQINSSAESFTGIATSICWDYNWPTAAWVKRPTRNPASLFRHVLQHPANAKALADVKLDLAALAAWHDYCRINGFVFDKVIDQFTSVFEVLRDIAAAGRASPTMRDGKWSVVIDQPKAVIAQYISPANSWEFGAVKTIVKRPHAFRVTYINSEKGYQPDELIVYDDAYNRDGTGGKTKATLFESIGFPGCTLTAQVYKHARMHLAQLKLRPEIYTVSMDLENLVCNYGDRVRVNHDTPLWGIGSGTISERIDGTHLRLSQPMPMDGGVGYSIVIRLKDGTSVTRAVAAEAVDGRYDEITLTSSVSVEQGEMGNLFLFGTPGNETNDCLVLGIESMDNITARLTLVDYSPAIYDSDTETIPDFDSNITLPPQIAQTNIKVKPVLLSLKSDETVMDIDQAGRYVFAIRSSFSHPANRPALAKYVEGEIRPAGSTTWYGRQQVPVSKVAMDFKNVTEAAGYYIRLRYASELGKTGPWVTSALHTVVGRATPPPVVTGLAFEVQDTGNCYLSWAKSEALDVSRYEVRTTNTGWGDGSHVYRGSGLRCSIVPAAAGVGKPFYVRAIDTINKYSATATATLTIVAPSAVAAVTQGIQKILTSSVNLALDWADSAEGSFDIAGYEIRTANSGWGTAGYKYRGRASSVILTGISSTTTTNFFIKAYDLKGNYSAVLAFSHDAVKPPNLTGALTLTRVTNVLKFSIPLPASLPADFNCYEFRIGKVGTPGVLDGTTADNFWDDVDCEVVRSPTRSAQISLTEFPTPRFSTAGIKYRVAVRLRDHSGNYSNASVVNHITITKIT